MQSKASGVLLLLSSALGLGVGCGELFAQTPDAAPRPGNRFYVTPASPFFQPQFQPDAELIRMDQAAQQLAAELRMTPDATKEAELKKLVEKVFTKRHAAQVAEAKALADKLAKLQEVLKKREDKKSEIIARRVKQLLGEADDLDWNLNSQHGFSGMTPFDDSRIRYMAPNPAEPLPPTTVSVEPPPAPPLTGPAPIVPPPPVPNGLPTQPPAPLGEPTRQPEPTHLPSTPAPTESFVLPRGILGGIGVPPAPPKVPSDDVKTLELELSLAKTQLEEAKTALKRSAEESAAGAVPQSTMDTLKFAVEKKKIELDLAARRLAIARERKKSEKNSPTP